MKTDSVIVAQSGQRLSYLFVLVLGFFYAVFLHYTLGMDGFFDTINYHYFIGWAALNFSSYDFGAVAQFHTYLNPLIDIVNYKAFSVHPYVGATFHAVLFSLAILFCYLLASFSFEVDRYKLSAIAAVAIGATGAMTVSLFGLFSNEHVTALLVLVALFLVVKNIEVGGGWAFFAAGIFIGFAAGLKLTAFSYVIGLLVTIFVCGKFNLRIIIFACVGAGFGFLLADGLFMILRFESVGNPIFPLANNIFKSPYYASEWKSFGSFEFKQIPYYLSLPYVWLTASDFSEAKELRDGRFLLAYIGLALIVAASLRKRFLTRKQCSIVLFFLVTWFTWILIFRIYRYLVVLEMLSGVIFLIGVSVFFGQKNFSLKLLSIVAAAWLLYCVTEYPYWGRRAWQDDFYKSDLIDVIGEDSVDIVFYVDPQLSYLSPQLKSSNIRFASLYSQPWYVIRPYAIPVDPKVVEISDKSKVYFLQYSKVDPRDSKVDPRAKISYLNSLFYGDIYSCKEVHTNIKYSPYLCSFKKLSDIKLSTVFIGESYRYDTDKVLFSSGWSVRGEGRLWTEGYKSNIIFKIDSIPENCNPFVKISGMALGEQLVTAYINGVEANKEKLSGQFESVINIGRLIASDKNTIRLDLDLPNATTANSSDRRLLAIALSSLSFGCSR
ncbi:PMT_2 domain-containing protein [Pseudomonas sp. IT-P74]|uniref:hypothetical protein n=1 Tax=Pseudomonas sp. IT-P74 TaxID=3026445 RepID=UPI0039E15962